MLPYERKLPVGRPRTTHRDRLLSRPPSTLVALVGESADIGVTYRDPDSVPLPDGSALAVADAIARLA